MISEWHQLRIAPANDCRFSYSRRSSNETRAGARGTGRVESECHSERQQSKSCCQMTASTGVSIQHSLVKLKISEYFRFVSVVAVFAFPLNSLLCAKTIDAQRNSSITKFPNARRHPRAERRHCSRAGVRFLLNLPALIAYSISIFGTKTSERADAELRRARSGHKNRSRAIIFGLLRNGNVYLNARNMHIRILLLEIILTMGAAGCSSVRILNADSLSASRHSHSFPFRAFRWHWN